MTLLEREDLVRGFDDFLGREGNSRAIKHFSPQQQSRAAGYGWLTACSKIQFPPNFADYKTDYKIILEEFKDCGLPLRERYIPALGIRPFGGY